MKTTHELRDVVIVRRGYPGYEPGRTIQADNRLFESFLKYQVALPYYSGDPGAIARRFVEKYGEQPNRPFPANPVQIEQHIAYMEELGREFEGTRPATGELSLAEEAQRILDVQTGKVYRDAQAMKAGA